MLRRRLISDKNVASFGQISDLSFNKALHTIFQEVIVLQLHMKCLQIYMYCFDHNLKIHESTGSPGQLDFFGDRFSIKSS